MKNVKVSLSPLPSNWNSLIESSANASTSDEKRKVRKRIRFLQSPPSAPIKRKVPKRFVISPLSTDVSAAKGLFGFPLYF